jgi:hypothetical protein
LWVTAGIETSSDCLVSRFAKYYLRTGARRGRMPVSGLDQAVVRLDNDNTIDIQFSSRQDVSETGEEVTELKRGITKGKASVVARDEEIEEKDAVIEQLDTALTVRASEVQEVLERKLSSGGICKWPLYVNAYMIESSTSLLES